MPFSVYRFTEFEVFWSSTVSVYRSRTTDLLFYCASTQLKRFRVFPPQVNVMADEEESSETISNVTAHPDVRTIFVELLGEVKKMNENFTNISYVDEEESLLSSTDNNKDQTARL